MVPKQLFILNDGRFLHIQKKMGDTKKTDHFRKMSSLMRFPRWWKSQNIIGWTTFKLIWSSERDLFLFFVKSISRNFLDRRHRNHLHHSFNSKKKSYKFLFVLACCSRIYNRYWIFIKLNDLAHKYTSFLAFAQLIYTHVFLNTNLLGYIGYCKRNKKRS